MFGGPPGGTHCQATFTPPMGLADIGAFMFKCPLHTQNSRRIKPSLCPDLKVKQDTGVKQRGERLEEGGRGTSPQRVVLEEA